MKVKAVPDGFHRISPYFSVRNAPGFIKFLEKAFDAKNKFAVKLPDGTLMSAEVQVGDSIVLVSEDDSEKQRDGSRAMFYMYVKDADAVYRKAIKAGAKSVMACEDQFWGDRGGLVEDIAGNRWWIATHKKEVSSKELVRRAMELYGE